MNLLRPSELRQRLNSPAEHAVFDVRESGEAHRGHLFGATFLPRRQIEFRIAALLPDRRTPVCLVDGGGSDQRAHRAAQTLERLGYQQVSVLDGGIQAWCASGEPLVTGSNVPSKLFGEEIQDAHQVPHIDVHTLKQWQQDGREHLVCDIRSPEEYRRSRIPGAFGAFGTDLALLAARLRAEAKPIVVHCSGRTRSIIACRSLQLLGVPDAVALENGTMGWRLAGFELEHGEGAGALPADASPASGGLTDPRLLAQEAGAQWVTAAQLDAWNQERMAGRSNVYMIDVRQLPDYIEGHLPGSIAVPGGLAIQRADEFVPVRAGRVVFIDHGEARSALAAYWYRKMGFPNVHVLRGGLQGWQETGGALEHGRGRERPLGWEDAARLARSIAPQALADSLASTPADAPGRAHIINVDTSAGAIKARLPGSEWIAYGDLEQRVAAMSPAQRARLVLTCRNGDLSSLAAANLARAGWPDVPVLAGGVDAWRAAGQAIEQGSSGDLAGASDLVVQPYDAGLAEMQRYLDWELQLTRQLKNQQAGMTPADASGQAPS